MTSPQSLAAFSPADATEGTESPATGSAASPTSAPASVNQLYPWARNIAALYPDLIHELDNGYFQSWALSRKRGAAHSMNDRDTGMRVVMTPESIMVEFWHPKIVCFSLRPAGHLKGDWTDFMRRIPSVDEILNKRTDAPETTYSFSAANQAIPSQERVAAAEAFHDFCRRLSKEFDKVPLVKAELQKAGVQIEQSDILDTLLVKADAEHVIWMGKRWAQELPAGHSLLLRGSADPEGGADLAFHFSGSLGSEASRPESHFNEIYEAISDEERKLFPNAAYIYVSDIYRFFQAATP